MSRQTVFRSALVGYWIVGLASATSSVMLEPTLPPLLQEHLAMELEAPLSTLEEAAFGLTLLSLLALIVASIGLWHLHRWAFWLFLGANLVGHVLTGALGAVVMDGFSGVLDDLADILLGVVIAMGFFADVLTEDDADGASTTDLGGT